MNQLFGLQHRSRTDPMIISRKEMVCADGNWDYGQ